MNSHTHIEAFTKFSTVFSSMRTKLVEWATSKGGAVDTEGFMSGLNENDNTHFSIRNEQLEVIAHYSYEVENLIQEQRMVIDRLRGEVRLLTTATRQQMRSDDEVLKNIEVLMKYEIQEETTMNDFEGALRDTIYFFELGMKRGLIDPTELINSKLDWARWFLKDQREMKIFYHNKKNKLYQIHESIESTFQASVEP